MFRSEYIRRVTELLRNRDIRKPVASPKHIFYISDDEGNKKSFVVRQTERNVIYTMQDVTVMLDAFIEVIKEALKNGDSLYLKGFGELGLKLYKGKTLETFGTGKMVEIEPRYLPKFTCGNDLRLCAKLYELKLKEARQARDNSQDDVPDTEGGE